MSEELPGGPLSGLVVIDLSRALAGPHASMILGDMGARVIKVEPPGVGDSSRSWGPPFVGPDDDPVSTYFLSANRNKESVQIDLKSEGGRELLEDLVRRADVLIENFRPGVLERLGVGVRHLLDLNDRLIILSITGFGHEGPEAGRAGYDQILQGEAGLMSLTGATDGGPTRVGVPIGDLLAGIYGAAGVLAALVDRERSGSGGVVRTSLLASLVGVHAFQGTRYTVAGEVPGLSGNHHPAIAPYGAFQTADGLIQVAVGTEPQWHAFASLVGLNPSGEGFATNQERVANRDQLTAAIESAFAGDEVEAWLDRFHSAGIPAGRVRSLDEVYSWSQLLRQGLLVEVDHPSAGRLQLPGPPLRFEGRDGEPRDRATHTAPPRLGENIEDVLAWLRGSS